MRRIPSCNEAPRLNSRDFSRFGISESGIQPEDHPIRVFTGRGLLLRDKIFYRRAYTLIEMLLVALLLSLTGLAVYHTIANGIRVWEYSRRYYAQEDAAVFFEKISADLQNVYSYSVIGWDAKGQKIFIPTVVRMLADDQTLDKDQMIEQIGAVEYFYQPDDKAIYRRQRNYSQALKPKLNLPASLLVSDVQALRFTYFLLEDGKLKPKKSISNQIPICVKVELDLGRGKGDIERFQRMINIPLGSPL